jgi:hypothetical protein
MKNGQQVTLSKPVIILALCIVVPVMLVKVAIKTAANFARIAF